MPKVPSPETFADDAVPDVTALARLSKEHVDLLRRLAVRVDDVKQIVMKAKVASGSAPMLELLDLNKIKAALSQALLECLTATKTEITVVRQVGRNGKTSGFKVDKTTSPDYGIRIRAIATVLGAAKQAVPKKKRQSKSRLPEPTDSVTAMRKRANRGQASC